MVARRRLASALFLSLAAGFVLGMEAQPRKTRPNRAAAPAKKQSGAPASSVGGNFRYTGEPISLDLKDADLKDVLKTFSKLARFNLAIDPDVKGSVTVRLENVRWDQALDVILRANGLGYVLEGNVVRVAAPGKLLP